MLQWISKNKVSFLKIAARMFIFFVAVFCFYKLFSPIPSLAASVADQNSSLNQGLAVIQEPLGLPATDIRLIIMRIIRAAFGLIGIVMVVLIIYAGFLWMTAGGNDEQIGKAKKIMINAVIGLAIMLSAVAIVSFVMNMLGVKGGAGGSVAGGGGEGVTENFRGSGALGAIIKDHYPSRDQTGVSRNTKIIITFFRPVVPASFIQNTNQSNLNNNPIYGDCTGDLSNLQWSTDCDQLILDDSHISISQSLTQNGETVLKSISGAAVLASYVTENNSQKLYTIVIRPNETLGNDQAEIKYTVRIGSAIKIDDPTNPDKGIFDGSKVGDNYYEWSFTCSKELDSAPPRVVGVYPAKEEKVERNTAIQIEFSEPMDPTGLQGSFVAGSNYYVDSSGNKEEAKGYIYLKPSHSSMPIGNFRLSNNYRTLEFISTKECGKNACGNNIFCLPVCDLASNPCPADANNTDNYRLLLKAGVIYGSTWEALPFSGITDVSGNALDGEPYNVKNKVPMGPPVPAVFPGQEKSDNYFWNFNIENIIATTSPYLIQITPGLDAENVAAGADWTMEFSKKLLVESTNSIRIEEKPTHDIPLWKTSRVDVSHTKVIMSKGPFLAGLRQYYFPVIDSNLVDVNYNCFYPGKGPGGAAEVNAKKIISSRCVNGENCCAVLTAQNAAYCCNGLVNANRATTDACLQFLKDPANSPD